MRQSWVIWVALAAGVAAFFWTLRQNGTPPQGVPGASGTGAGARGARPIRSPRVTPRLEPLLSAVRENRDDLEAWYTLARLHEAGGRDEEAARAWGEVRRVAEVRQAEHPGRATSWYYMAWADHQTGRREEARESFRLAGAAYRDRIEDGDQWSSNPTIWMRLSWCRRMLGDDEGARRSLRQAVRLLEDRREHLTAEDLYNLASCKALLGREREALAGLRAAAEAGYGEAEWAWADEDLEPLRAHPEFSEIVKTMRPAERPIESDG